MAALVCVFSFFSVAAFCEPLLTRWSDQVTSSNALPEYPRPQLVRSDWQNLNGQWEFEITRTQPNPPAQFEEKILVPFPIESYLSGIERGFDDNSVAWYRRKFNVPAAWKGRLVKIHFGAVDWHAKILVNGVLLGVHSGGFDAFSFDITRALKFDEENEIIVAVTDPTEGDQPRGKQTRKAEGIFYTPSSGIWQTVWLEPLPEEHISGIHMVPNTTETTLQLTVLANCSGEDLMVTAAVSFAGKEVGRVTGRAGEELEIALREKHLWSPATPDLYDVTVSLQRGKDVRDRVLSYFGLREVRVEAAADGFRRLFLNGEPFFQMGVLDQGFWPDGLYTAPTDEALRYDLEVAKKLGFNMVRKHVKVESERWYYWADKLGLLVWQDMPSGNNSTELGRRQFQVELDRLIDQKANHPSIIMWVLFNEGWGQFDTERLTRRIKAADPTRLVNNASGWTDMRVGDVMDLHSYPLPLAPKPEPVRAGVLGEFGGLGLGITNHIWKGQQPWGYQVLPDAELLTEKYVDLLNELWGMRKSLGLAAAVYTQLADVETECNGFMTYDREVMKMDLARVNRANLNTPKLLPDARDGKFAWLYTTEPPPANWMHSDFDASGWRIGDGGFGAPNPPGAVIHTEWKGPDIWVRRDFELKPGTPPPATIDLYHDEDAEVYINGVLAVTAKGFVTTYKEYALSQVAIQAFRPGRNVVAIHCFQSRGGQYLDAGFWPRFDP